jgi:hypothetical protein
MLTLADADVDALESSLLGLEDQTDIGSALEPLRRARAAVGAAAT